MVLLWPPGPEARCEVERAVLLGDERVEDVGKELHGRRPLGVVGGEDESELEDRVGVVPCAERAVSGPECRGARAAVREHGPWWTKKTASQTMRLSALCVCSCKTGTSPTPKTSTGATGSCSPSDAPATRSRASTRTTRRPPSSARCSIGARRAQTGDTRRCFRGRCRGTTYSNKDLGWRIRGDGVARLW